MITLRQSKRQHLFNIVFGLATLFFASTGVAQNKVVVIPLGDTEGVYADISGIWSGVIEGAYLALVNIQEHAEIGKAAATIGYIQEDDFQCSGVETRVSENGNTYTFSEQVVIDDSTCTETGTVVLTYDPASDTINYEYNGSESGTLRRVIDAPDGVFDFPIN